jgi:phosphoribosylamine--glycine ligase
MNVLIIGSGGREHALAWKLRQSLRVTQLFAAPGNGGLAELATCLPIGIHDHDALVRAAHEHRIGLTVVGPDDALAAGLVDRFEREGLRIFGPTQAAARLESSKGFAKAFMERHGIPTARAGTFTDPDAARAFAREMPKPVVV